MPGWKAPDPNSLRRETVSALTSASPSAGFTYPRSQYAAQFPISQRLLNLKGVKGRILLRGGLLFLEVAEGAAAKLQTNHARRPIRKGRETFSKEGRVVDRVTKCANSAAEANSDLFPRLTEYMQLPTGTYASAYRRLIAVRGIRPFHRRRGSAMNFFLPGQYATVDVPARPRLKMRRGGIFRRYDKHRNPVSNRPGRRSTPDEYNCPVEEQ